MAMIPIDEFIGKWGLDERCAELLASTDEATCSRIMSEFQPRSNTNDPSAKFMSFARSVQGAGAASRGEVALSPEKQAFADRWTLDDHHISWLAELEPRVAAILISEFDPRDDTKNVGARMRAFAQSVQTGQVRSRGGGGGGHAIGASWGGGGAAWGGGGDRLSEFGRYWSLTADTVMQIRTLPAHVQTVVIDEFNPRGDTFNLDGKVWGFAKSIAARVTSGGAGAMSRKGSHKLDVVDSFAAQWQLDDETRQWFRSLPQPVIDTVMKEFDPKVGTHNPAGKLRGFAKGILAKFDSSTSSASSYDPVITEFVQRWNLDSSAVELLESLTDDVRSVVLTEFEPRNDTRNLLAKLRAFAATIGTGSKKSKPSTEVPEWVDWSPETPEEEAFLDTWGFRENMMVLDAMQKLSASARARVIAEFLPDENTQDPAGKFVSFAKSVGSGKSAGKGGKAPAWGPAKSFGEASWGGAKSFGGGSRGTGSKGGFAARGFGGGGFKGASGASDPDAFADQWELDAGARALLRGLDAHAQARVIAEFQPNGVTRDLSGKFCAFARSVAAAAESAGRNPTGVKRKMGGYQAGPPASFARMW